MKWISIADQLPPINEWVLVYTPGDYPNIQSDRLYTRDDGLLDWDTCTLFEEISYGYEYEIIRFWCPLPNLPWMPFLYTKEEVSKTGIKLKKKE